MSRINTVYRTFLNQLMSVRKSNALSDNLALKLQAQCHLQARRQEIKWGGFVKVENGGAFFVKWTFPVCIMYSISIFYFTF